MNIVKKVKHFCKNRGIEISLISLQYLYRLKVQKRPFAFENKKISVHYFDNQLVIKDKNEDSTSRGDKQAT